MGATGLSLIPAPLLVHHVYSTAVKDRIVAFLLFLGKLAITCAVGELEHMIVT